MPVTIETKYRKPITGITPGEFYTFSDQFVNHEAIYLACKLQDDSLHFVRMYDTNSPSHGSGEILSMAEMTDDPDALVQLDVELNCIQPA